MTTVITPDGIAEHDATLEDDIEALLDLDNDDFAGVISDALFYAVGPVEKEPDWQCLFHPDVVKRTYEALIEAKRATEANLTAAKKSRNQGALNVERRRWDAIELRLKQARGSQAKSPRDAHIELQERNAREARNAVRLLAVAIHRHRLAAVAAALDPEPADRALWATLDEVQIAFRDSMVTLTEMLGTGVWTEERG
ncbi:hypothetical protein [Dactylosporangium salmoneum]